MYVPSLTKLAVRYSVKSLVLANAVWLYFLIRGATALHTGASHKAVSIGPLIVNHLDKSQLPGGAYTLRLSFTPGLFWFELSCIVVGCLAAAIHIWLIKHNQKRQ